MHKYIHIYIHVIHAYCIYIHIYCPYMVIIHADMLAYIQYILYIYTYTYILKSLLIFRDVKSAW